VRFLVDNQLPPAFAIEYTGDMANVVDPRNLAAPSSSIPGLKPPVWDFSPTDDGDPGEVDRFNAMLRDLREQELAVHPDAE
jgi:hypothetical protein